VAIYFNTSGCKRKKDIYTAVFATTEENILRKTEGNCYAEKRDAEPKVNKTKVTTWTK
jgi:hypothetical protein